MLVDVISQFNTWQSRIHIGRYNDVTQWKNSIAKVSSKWLNNTPKIKVTDNTRFTVIDRLKGNYSNSAIQYWQEASLLQSISENSNNNTGDIYINQIQKFMSKKFNVDGEWRQRPQEIDCAILAYAVLKSKEDDKDKYKPAFDYT